MIRTVDGMEFVVYRSGDGTVVSSVLSPTADSASGHGHSYRVTRGGLLMAEFPHLEDVAAFLAAQARPAASPAA